MFSKFHLSPAWQNPRLLRGVFKPSRSPSGVSVPPPPFLSGKRLSPGRRNTRCSAGVRLWESATLQWEWQQTNSKLPTSASSDELTYLVCCLHQQEHGPGRKAKALQITTTAPSTRVEAKAGISKLLRFGDSKYSVLTQTALWLKEWDLVVLV